VTSPLLRVKLRFSLLAFFYSFAAGLPMGLIVLFLQGRGIDLLGVGVLLAVQSAVVVLLELPTGALADVWGRKKVLVLAFAAGAAAAFVALISTSFVSFMVSMLLSGLCRALLSGTADALFVDSLHEVAPEDDLHHGFSQIWVGIGLGIASGAMAGGFIPGLFPGLPPSGPAILTRLSMPILFSMGVWLIVALGAALLLQEPAKAATTARSGARGIADVVRQSVAFAVKSRLVSMVIVAAAISALAISAVETFWQPQFARLLGSAVDHSRLFGAIVAATFVLSALGSALGRPVERLARGRHGLVSALAACSFGAVTIVLALQTGFRGALVAFCVVYLFTGLAGPVLQALFNNSIPTGNRATMISFLTLCMRAGVLAGGLGLGFLASHFSISVAWIASGCLSLTTVPLFLYVERLRSRLSAAPTAAPEAAGPLPDAAEPIRLA
jgi:MFS family permease